MTKLDDLLPCPFCGSLPTRKISNAILSIECPSCDFGFHNHVRFGCEADTKWNTRVQQGNQAIVVENLIRTN